ncbi:unnamed protein product [Cladocopium goreaui]|uniref:H(+)-exporting diphosphatase n=1 Tax=Cladocopium goreaui TaxID=2562237 RepID=A0A9P1CFV4_9DINO|nr:unnamed protein product [Cladocopium goreaui]
MLIFGNVLAMMAGIIDVASILSFSVTTTHVTGNTAKMGMYIGHDMNEQIDYNKAVQLGLCVTSFCFGSFLCGLIIPKTQVHIGGKGLYGTALIAESVLLLVCYFDPDHQAAPYWAAMASGLQNAMCTMHFGAVVRTTHVTGCITDIGSTAGRAAILLVRRFCHKEGSGMQLLDEAELHVDKRKLLVLVPLYVFFLGGCIVGALCFRSIAHNTFLIPAIVTGFMGLVYSTLRETLKTTFKNIEQTRLVSDLGEVHDTLDRTYRTIRRIQHTQHSRGSSGRLEPMDELDEQMNHVAEMVQDMEHTLGEMYEADRDRDGREGVRIAACRLQICWDGGKSKIQTVLGYKKNVAGNLYPARVLDRNSIFLGPCDVLETYSTLSVAFCGFMPGFNGDKDPQGVLLVM